MKFIFIKDNLELDEPIPDEFYVYNDDEISNDSKQCFKNEVTDILI
jgi:hypothetical protein